MAEIDWGVDGIVVMVGNKVFHFTGVGAVEAAIIVAGGTHLKWFLCFGCVLVTVGARSLLEDGAAVLVICPVQSLAFLAAVGCRDARGAPMQSFICAAGVIALHCCFLYDLVQYLYI